MPRSTQAVALEIFGQMGHWQVQSGKFYVRVEGVYGELSGICVCVCVQDLTVEPVCSKHHQLIRPVSPNSRTFLKQEALQ